MTLFGYCVIKASRPLICAAGSFCWIAPTSALYSAGSLRTGAGSAGAAGCDWAADPAGWAGVACPGGGCVAWAAANAAAPSTTVTRIFFISMAPWACGNRISGSYFLNLYCMPLGLRITTASAIVQSSGKLLELIAGTQGDPNSLRVAGL